MPMKAEQRGPRQKAGDTLPEITDGVAAIIGQLLGLEAAQWAEGHPVSAREFVTKVMNAMTLRERRVVKARYGLVSGSPQKWDAVAQREHIPMAEAQRVGAGAIQRLGSNTFRLRMLFEEAQHDNGNA